MRTLVALFLGLAVVLVSPSGAFAQQAEASTSPNGPVDASGQPADYTVPGYYETVQHGLNYRYYDGQEWSGPIVGSQTAGLHAWLRLTGHGDALDVLTAALGGGGDGLYLALILLALLAIELPNGGAPTTPFPAPTPSSSPSLSPSPDPPQPDPPQVEGGVTLSPNYRFVWDWGSTSGGFDGAVTGDIGGWTYTGTSIHSWPPELHAWGGSASCTFEGDPDAPAPEAGWPMDCDLYWQGDATWTGQISGRFFPYHDETGTLTDFQFKGAGQGTDGGDWSPIHILLKPCEPGAAC